LREPVDATDPGLAASPLEPILAARAEEWKGRYAGWLGGLNQANGKRPAAPLHWWALPFTAKNLLSVPLGRRLFEALAVVEMRRTQSEPICVVGASAGQRAVVRALLAADGIPVDDRSTLRQRLSDGAQRLLAPLYALGHVARVAATFVLRPRPSVAPAEICLFTYADPPFSRDRDLYFGTLHQTLARLRPGARLQYLSWVEAPYAPRLDWMRREGIEGVAPLFAFLRMADCIWAACAVLALWLRPRIELEGRDVAAADLRPLLEEALAHDLSTGGWVTNLLAYRAARRVAGQLRPELLLYPYENKSLEKMLLLGIRARPGVRAVGYQHTSITPRHVTLLLAPGEAAVTPLPDRVVTVGEVSLRYLERHGNYPAGLLVEGCALRQRWREPLPERSLDPAKPRILLALSSSRAELVRAVAFFRSVMRDLPNLELGVRTHPNFPLRRLPGELRRWVDERAIDKTGTPLEENLEWCDLVAYISSTVALEALMVGRPVLNLRLDAPDPDPLLGDVPARWEIAAPAELAPLLARIASLGGDAMRVRRQQSIDYARAYLAPVTDEALGRFLE
jgi:hypothetical protein